MQRYRVTILFRMASWKKYIPRIFPKEKVNNTDKITAYM